MPDVGDVESKFGRRYMFLNPNPALGPGTWRLSMPETYPPDGGGGIVDIDGELPIVVDTDFTGATTVSMDIEQLDDREP